jgi:hypothetical protein
MKANLTAALLLVVATLANVGMAAPANERPLTDAGLDQTVERGTRVALDGAGSRDPDGRIVSYRWSIETPNGEVIEPVNATRPRTSFTPTRLGRYRVTLTVIGDEGKRGRDTLYVDVVRGERPTVSISGTERTRAGETNIYRVRASRGSAPLRRLVWRVDGDVVARRSIADGERDSLNASFADSGPHEVSVKVVDADGLYSAANHTVQVRTTAGGDGPSTPSGRGGGNTPLATRHDPSVRGPDLLIGDPPFESTYRVAGTNGGSVDSIRWFTDRTAGPTGRTANIDWVPGTHRIHAVVQYADGSRDLVRFQDGSSEVVVDPAPQVSLPTLDGWNGLSGRGTASDEYENLRSVSVAVDGQTVERWPETAVESRGRTVAERSLRFSVPDASVNQNHTVTVTAVDARGQRRQVSRKIPVAGQPEIVKAEFVNGPVDSYHERLDPKRYTAKHVLKIDLNGVSKRELDWNYKIYNNKIKNIIVSKKNHKKVEYNPDRDTLKIVTFWFGRKPGQYPIKGKINSQKESVTSNETVLNVENSPPILNLDVRNRDYPHQATEWDVVVDASGSFDPDGDGLRFIWRQGAKPITADNTTAKFSVIHRASLLLKDRTGRTTQKDFNYLDYITPPIREATVVGEGPFRANDTVLVHIRTIDYDLNKNSYSIDLRPVVDGAAESVTRWEKRYDDSDEIRKTRFWEGVVEVPASAFLNGDPPEVRVYNTERPNHRSERYRIPDPSVLLGVERRPEEVRAKNVRYVVERQARHKVRATSQTERDRYLRRGYDIDSKETERRYLVKERVKVSDATYEKRSQSFPTASARQLFVRNNPDWSTAGVETRTRRRSVRRTEWRNTKQGRGTYLHETRRVEISPPEYRTEKQFRYTKETEHTAQRTVTYWDTVTKQKTYTKEIKKCLKFGCYYTTQTFTRTVTDRVQRSYQEKYTYTTTETERYWSSSKYDRSHEFTGRTRRTQVQDAQYATQYLYEYDSVVKEQVRTYLATRRVLVDPAQYAWRTERTVDSPEKAYRISRQGTYRVKSRTRVVSWKMSKQTPATKEITNRYSDEENVIETRATLHGTETVRGLDPESGNYRVIEEKPFRKTVHISGVATRSQLIKSLRDSQEQKCDAVGETYRKECSKVG